MSTLFSKIFQRRVKNVVDDLDTVPRPGNVENKVYKSALSPGSILPGDVLFFTYRSDKFGTGEHLIMVIGNERGPTGTFNGTDSKGRSKRYISAVKLNNVWSFTAALIISAYQDRQVKYTKKSSDKLKASFMSLVGRKNYRTYIMNNIQGNAMEVADRKEG